MRARAHEPADDPRAGEAIASHRIALVALRETHADALVALLSEPLLRQWLRAENLVQLRERFKSWEVRRSPDGAEQWLNWMVLSRGDERPLGWVQVTIRDHCASIAYAVLPDERGHGVAVEAVTLVTRRLQRDFDIATIEAEIDPANTPSEVVAARAGFGRTDRVCDAENVWIVLRPLSDAVGAVRSPGGNAARTGSAFADLMDEGRPGR